jgi:hypothetical protein
MTGASGDYYYGRSSYLDAAFLASRVNGIRKIYHWESTEEPEEGVESLAAACALPERPAALALFPDDGERYRLRAASNQQSARLVSTVNRYRDLETGEWVHKPNIATFGYGMREEDGRYFVTLNIGRNNSCHNAISSGDMRFSYYEYDSGQPDKALRNRGARIIGRVDYTRTALFAFFTPDRARAGAAGSARSPSAPGFFY